MEQVSALLHLRLPGLLTPTGYTRIRLLAGGAVTARAPGDMGSETDTGLPALGTASTVLRSLASWQGPSFLLGMEKCG